MGLEALDVGGPNNSLSSASIKACPIKANSHHLVDCEDHLFGIACSWFLVLWDMRGQGSVPVIVNATILETPSHTIALENKRLRTDNTEKFCIEPT